MMGLLGIIQVFQDLVTWTASGSDGSNYITSSWNPTYATQGGGNWYYSASDGTLFKSNTIF